MTDTLFLNLMRTSLALSVPALALILASPAWNRSFAALWKKRLWCLIAAMLLLAPWVRLPEGVAGMESIIPELQVLSTLNGSRGTQTAPENPGTPAEGPGISDGTQQSAGEGGQAAVTPTEKRLPDLLTVAEIVWAAGAAIFAVWIILGEYLFRRRIRRWARPVHSETITAVYRDLSARKGGRKYPELLVLPDIGTPMLTGLFRPRLLLPAEEYTETEADYILRHEMTHWKGKDIWYKALLLAANAVHWFNPAVWLIRREAAFDLERACDERVLQNADMDERRTYGGVLLSVARKGLQPALSTYFFGGGKVMRERMSNILSNDKRRGAAPAACFALLTVCAVFLVSCTQQAPGAAPSFPGGYEHAATLQLSDTEPYAPETVYYPEAAEESDISEVITSRNLEDGTEVLFYWSKSGEKYCAYRTAGSKTLIRFTKEDNEYQNGYAIETYAGLFGHDGFIIECPRGAAYQAFDYYYFDEGGTLKLLAQCANFVIDRDINGDGERELMWFYHGGRDCYYYFEKDGFLYLAEISAMLVNTMTDWSDIYTVPDGFADGALPFRYSLVSGSSDALPLEGMLRFTPEAIEVYIQGDQNAPEPTDQYWKSAELAVIEGIPNIRHGAAESWTALGPAIAAPREWSAEQDLAGRGEAATLIGEPEIRIGLVSAKDGWLTATYGRGVAAADTYIYRTHDGGRTWTEAGQLTEAHWYPCAAAFVDDKRAVIAVGIFTDAPIFCTQDGGETWSLAELPFSQGIWEARSMGFDGEGLTMTVMDKAGSGGTRTLASGDGGATWEPADPAES